MTGDDWYAGIVVTNDGRCYRLGRDGWPIEQPYDEVLAERAELDAPTRDADLPDAADGGPHRIVE
ncbi:hypothetical protein [Nocardia carnea]|uniref:hypothetical protein n=1 Tax=Nocardia carnea TaxID=37328 RepID=UPI002458CE88|nr:hypothetical protein [Nocardia carnea]